MGKVSAFLYNSKYILMHLESSLAAGLLSTFGDKYLVFGVFLGHLAIFSPDLAAAKVCQVV